MPSSTGAKGWPSVALIGAGAAAYAVFLWALPLASPMEWAKSYYNQHPALTTFVFALASHVVAQGFVGL